MRVAVYDARPIVAEGLAAVLAGAGDLDVVGAASDVDELAGAIGGLGVQVVVFGIGQGDPERSGELVARLTASASTAGRKLGLVAVVPGGQAEAERVELAGFSSVVGAVASPASLRAAVTSACPGRHPAPASRPVFTPRPRAAESTPSEPSPSDRLTPRERDVLRGIELGHSSREIAAALDVSVNTVRTHVQNLMPKLGVHSRLQAAALAASDRSVAGIRDPGTEPDQGGEL